MLKPIKNIPLKLVIESLTGHSIVSFDKDKKENIELLQNLIQVANSSLKEINRTPILRTRANEVGNDVENFVKESLIQIGYNADTPLTKSGTRQSTGYPDIEFMDKYNRVVYLECKTYNSRNFDTSFRSFYLSPSKNTKITKDAFHLCISFEIYEDGRKNNKNIYKSRGWKILTLENLSIDVKHEFNSDNKRLYDNNLILAEKNIQ